MTLKTLRKFMVFSLIFLLFFSMALAKSSPKYNPVVEKKFQAPIQDSKAWIIDLSTFGNYIWTYMNVGIWPGQGMADYWGPWPQMYPKDWDNFWTWWDTWNLDPTKEILYFGEFIYGNDKVMNGSVWQYCYDQGGDIDGWEDIYYLAAVDSISQMDVLTGFSDFPATAKYKLFVGCTWRALNWNYPNVDDFQAHIWTFYNYGNKTSAPFWVYFNMDWDIDANTFGRDAAVYYEDTWAGMTYNVDSGLSGGFRFINTAPWSMYTTSWNDPFWEIMDVNKAEDEFKYLWEPQIFNTRLNPDDYRTNYIAGPFVLEPGEEVEVDWAFIFGPSVGQWEGNNSVLTLTYEAGWKPPNPPPDAPYITLVPGDRKVTINWTRNRSVNPKVNNDGTKDYTEYPDSTFNRSAESSIDPNTGLKDWDGYLLYRNMSGSGELNDGAWHLISEMTSTYVYNTWGTIPDPDLDARYWTQSYYAHFTDDDPGLYNGFRYYYSVVAYDKAKAVTNPTANVQSVILKWKAASSPSNVKVVPNPYVVSSPTGFVTGVQFVHLPANCTIKIYTMSGDYILSLYHNDGSGDETWDLRNENDQLVAPGVYFWVVESDQGTQKGKFVIIQ